jgi:hypothetical protein
MITRKLLEIRDQEFEVRRRKHFENLNSDFGSQFFLSSRIKNIRKCDNRSWLALQVGLYIERTVQNWRYLFCVVLLFLKDGLRKFYD